MYILKAIKDAIKNFFRCRYFLTQKAKLSRKNSDLVTFGVFAGSFAESF